MCSRSWTLATRCRFCSLRERQIQRAASPRRRRRGRNPAPPRCTLASPDPFAAMSHRGDPTNKGAMKRRPANASAVAAAMRAQHAQRVACRIRPKQSAVLRHPLRRLLGRTTEDRLEGPNPAEGTLDPQRAVHKRTRGLLEFLRSPSPAKQLNRHWGVVGRVRRHENAPEGKRHNGHAAEVRARNAHGHTIGTTQHHWNSILKLSSRVLKLLEIQEAQYSPLEEARDRIWSGRRLGAARTSPPGNIVTSDEGGKAGGGGAKPWPGGGPPAPLPAASAPETTPSGRAAPATPRSPRAPLR